MKSYVFIVCAATSLSGCFADSSCDGVPAPRHPEYISMTADWVSNNAETAVEFIGGSPSGELSLLDLNATYTLDEVAIGVSGLVDFPSEAAVAKPARFGPLTGISLFSSAYACSPVPPHIEANLMALQVLVSRSSSDVLAAGTDVTHLFSVAASRKDGTAGLPLVDWNLVVDSHIDWVSGNSWPAFRATTLLVFSDTADIGAGEVAFSITATLENGQIFTFETAPLTISGASSLND